MIVNISIPPNGVYRVVNPFWISVDVLRFVQYKLNGFSVNPGNLPTKLSNVEQVLGFNVNRQNDMIEIPHDIKLRLKIKLTQVIDKIELNVPKKLNKGMEPFYLIGSSTLFAGILLESQ